jgi:hypothetical protein
MLHFIRCSCSELVDYINQVPIYPVAPVSQTRWHRFQLSVLISVVFSGMPAVLLGNPVAPVSKPGGTSFGQTGRVLLFVSGFGLLVGITSESSF